MRPLSMILILMTAHMPSACQLNLLWHMRLGAAVEIRDFACVDVQEARDHWPTIRRPYEAGDSPRTPKLSAVRKPSHRAVAGQPRSAHCRQGAPSIASPAAASTKE